MHTSVLMKLRDVLMLCKFLCIAAVQVWVSCVILLTRQTELLMLCSISFRVFWAWSSWELWLLKWYAQMVLASLCLAATLVLAVLLFWSLIDDSDILQNSFILAN